MKTLCALFSILISSNALALEQDSFKPVLSGKAYDTKTNELIYKEEHRYKKVQGSVVMNSVFTDINDNTIAERVLEYQGDKVKSYKLEQNKIGYKESIIRDSRSVKFEEHDGEKVDIEEVSIKSDIVIDAGFSDYIVRNWDALNNGEALKFDFASVSQMGMLKLRVKRAEKENTSAKNILDDVVMFKMTLASPILKIFIKPIEIGYYKDSKQLAFYKGISNLKDSTGKQYSSVRIEYSKAASAG